MREIVFKMERPGLVGWTGGGRQRVHHAGQCELHDRAGSGDVGIVPVYGETEEQKGHREGYYPE